jgi:uroporphyrinogen decarboxylase
MHTEDCIRMLRVHCGFFESMGVGDWQRLSDVIYLLTDDPDFVIELMTIQGKFSAKVAARVLEDIEVDAAIFSEPIAGNHGPLISPQMYEKFVLKSYEPLLDILRDNSVDIIVFRTYANARILIPSILQWGFNCLWAHEVDAKAMDYRELRSAYGRDLRLIGGIDLDALRYGKDSIRHEIEQKVPPLLAQGGYVPMLDGRVREDVSFENYAYYRRLLEKATKI